MSGGSTWPLLGGGSRRGLPDPAGDLTSWPRRGTSLYALLTDGAWAYDAFAQYLQDHRLNFTRVWLLTADWIEQTHDIVWPFAKLPDGRYDLFAWNPAYFDRLARVVAALDSRGIVAQLDVTELYAWSERKQGLQGVPDANKGPWRNNINGVRWVGDETLYALPDAWLSEFIERAVSVVKGRGVVFESGNEMPEKPMLERIRDAVRRTWPEAIVGANRDEPGQYANMRIGPDPRGFNQLAYHGKRDLASLDSPYDNGAAVDRPSTIRALLDRADTDGRRIIFSSDGCRASEDRFNTYDWPALLEVFAYVWRKGCSIEHQSRAKMTRIQTGRADLGMLETAFLDQIAAL